MFHHGKIIWLFFKPSTLIGFLFLLGLLSSFYSQQLSRRLLFCTALLFVILGFFPIGYNIVHFWESQYQYPVTFPSKVDGIIVLGGATETDLSAAHGIYALNESGERLSQFAALVLKFPEAKAVFTGGQGNPDTLKGKEADYARSFLQSLGLPVEKILFEDQSRNTYENAVFSKKQVNPAPGETWLLVSSAFHMPRSVAVFNSQGWDVVPVPVDFQTGENYKIWPLDIHILKNFRFLDVGVKEAIGLATYKLTGKIK